MYSRKVINYKDLRSLAKRPRGEDYFTDDDVNEILTGKKKPVQNKECNDYFDDEDVQKIIGKKKFGLPKIFNWAWVLDHKVASILMVAISALLILYLVDRKNINVRAVNLGHKLQEISDVKKAERAEKRLLKQQALTAKEKKKLELQKAEELRISEEKRKEDQRLAEEQKKLEAERLKEQQEKERLLEDKEKLEQEALEKAKAEEYTGQMKLDQNDPEDLQAMIKNYYWQIKSRGNANAIAVAEGIKEKAGKIITEYKADKKSLEIAVIELKKLKEEIAKVK